MTYQLSTYEGDNIYKINCTGDACVGDEVCFEQATFTGSYKALEFAGFERIVGKIESESYGVGRGQHTFNITCEGFKVLIKGRNLYKQGLYRKPWEDENLRHAVLHAKHERGNRARARKGFL